MKISLVYSKAIIALNVIVLLVVSFIFVAFEKNTDKELPYVTDQKSRVTVTGFTNLSKWRMDTDYLKCDSRFVFSGGDLKEITYLKFSTPIIALKSTHAIMDTVVYKMLSASGVKEITFRQTRHMVLPKMKMVNIIGDLTIGAVTRKIDLQLSYTINNDKEINFKGLKKLVLREFNITRNNALLKAIKFDDEVMIQIEMNLTEGDITNTKKEIKILAE